MRAWLDGTSKACREFPPFFRVFDFPLAVLCTPIVQYFSSRSFAISKQVHADSSSYTSNVIYVQTTKAASNQHRYFKANENNGSATSLQILGNGNVQNANNSFGAISDQRIKQDVTDANSQWADIKALNFKTYRHA